MSGGESKEDFLNKTYVDKSGLEIVADAMNYTTKSNEFEISTEMDFDAFKTKYFNNCDVGDDDYDACIDLYAYYKAGLNPDPPIQAAGDGNFQLAEQLPKRSGERRRRLKEKLENELNELTERITIKMKDGTFKDVTDRSKPRQRNFQQRKKRESFERALQRLDKLDTSSKPVTVQARNVRLRL